MIFETLVCMLQEFKNGNDLKSPEEIINLEINEESKTGLAKIKNVDNSFDIWKWDNKLSIWERCTY